MRALQGPVMSLRHLMTVSKDDHVGMDSKKEKGVSHEEDEGLDRSAFDDVTGEVLDPKEVMRARLKELDYINNKGVWKKIPRREAWEKGIKIIKSRWIDVNTGDGINPNYRSRFVGKEFNDGWEEGLFAATPPLEALRLLVSEAATTDEKGELGNKVIMINDIARAFFEADATRVVCVELLDEAKTEEDWKEDTVAILKKSLYGTRDAAANFQSEVKKFMTKLGFTVGKYNVCTYFHKQKQLRTMIHGDDFITVGARESAKWFRNELEKRSEVKTTVVGNAKGCM